MVKLIKERLPSIASSRQHERTVKVLEAADIVGRVAYKLRTYLEQFEEEVKSLEVSFFAETAPSWSLRLRDYVDPRIYFYGSATPIPEIIRAVIHGDPLRGIKPKSFLDKQVLTEVKAKKIDRPVGAIREVIADVLDFLKGYVATLKGASQYVSREGLRGRVEEVEGKVKEVRVPKEVSDDYERLRDEVEEVDRCVEDLYRAGVEAFMVGREVFAAIYDEFLTRARKVLSSLERLLPFSHYVNLDGLALDEVRRLKELAEKGVEEWARAVRGLTELQRCFEALHSAEEVEARLREVARLVSEFNGLKELVEALARIGVAGLEVHEVLRRAESYVARLDAQGLKGLKEVVYRRVEEARVEVYSKAKELYRRVRGLVEEFEALDELSPLRDLPPPIEAKGADGLLRLSSFVDEVERRLLEAREALVKGST